MIDYKELAKKNKREVIFPVLLLIVGFIIMASATGFFVYNGVRFIREFVDTAFYFLTADRYVGEQQGVSDFLYAYSDIELSNKYNSEGVQYLKNGDYEKAKSYFEKSIEKNPNNYRSYHNLGTTFWRKKDLSSAIRYYKIAIGLNPNYEDSRMDLIGVYKENHNCLEAKNEGEYFVKNFPESKHVVTVRWGLAISYQCLSQHQEAIREFIAALSLRPNEDPDNYRIYNDIGVSYEALGNYKKAIEYFSSALDALGRIKGGVVEPKARATIYNNLGNAYSRQDDMETARKMYKKATEFSPAGF